MGLHPIHHQGYAAHSGAVRDLRAVDHDNRQAKGAGGGNFGDSAFAARVFGNHDVDAMVTQQGRITCKGKGAARDGDAGARQRQIIGGRINKAQQILVLRGCGKGRQMLPPDGQKHPARGGAKAGGCAGKVGHMQPIILRGGDPRRAFKGEQRNACGLTGQDRVGAYLRGKGMRGVDDMGDAFGGKIGLQARNTTKAAHACGQGLGDGGIGAASVGIDGIGVIIGQRAGQQASLGCAAQKKDAHDV